MLKTQIREALSAAAPFSLPDWTVAGDAALPSVFDVTGLATATIGAVCAEASAYRGVSKPFAIDSHLASEWFTFCIDPMGWDLPPVWDAIAGVYRTKDGFIRLHTNAPHHREAALSVLQCEAHRDTVASVVATWASDDLESAVVAANGCAAALRSTEEWAAHPQGRAVAAVPLIDWTVVGQGHAGTRPLQTVRILDLTRVLAGPVATRTLAGFGAQVLRIDPPGWEEAICEPEVTWGKRLATLDLKTDAGRDRFLALLRDADVLVHGYRADAMEGLGLGEAVRRAANPDLIDVAHNAYGWTGPWAGRRGFDSLVQMSCGIAHAGMRAAGSDAPVPLPVQALDYGTGYLIAAAVLRALRVRSETGAVMKARLSLARTAALLMGTSGPGLDMKRRARTDADFQPPVETAWGPARRLTWPGPEPMVWSRPPRPFHSDEAVWT